MFFFQHRIEKVEVLNLSETEKMKLLGFYSVGQLTVSLNRSQGSPPWLQSLGVGYPADLQTCSQELGEGILVSITPAHFVPHGFLN